MNHDLKHEARTAVVGAAERLGVDPYRLARFLSNGRLAEILTRMRESPEDGAGTLPLAESYLEFLEREIELRAGPPPSAGGEAPN
jgi:hypothetical protein